MYKVYFRFYNVHELSQIRIVGINVTTEVLVELLPFVHVPINNFFYNDTEVPIASRLKILFSDRDLIRYLRFVNVNSECNVCFMIDKILKS